MKVKSLGMRGDSTRLALINAGLDLFGEHGFKATTTRMLSDHAQANISAIPYYFGGKKGLYIAVMEYIVERIHESFGDVKRSVGRLLKEGDVSKVEALEAIKLMILKFAELFVESDEPKSWAQLILREQAKPTEAFDVIYEGLMMDIQKIHASLVSIYTGLDPDSDEVKLRCHTLMGQILVFITSRESLLRHLGVRNLKPSHITLTYNILLAHTEACLNIPLVRENIRDN